MYDARLTHALDLLRERPPRLGTTKLVAVDGPAGSGKTTLAAALVDRIRGEGRLVELLHLDDLYEGWTGLDTALERRLLGQVIAPLAIGRPGRWQRYDWYAGRFAEWHDLPVTDVLVLEGCGSGAMSYADYLSLLIWVSADRDTRVARGVARDGEAVLPLWLDWMTCEAKHFADNDTAARADLVIETSAL